MFCDHKLFSVLEHTSAKNINYNSFIVLGTVITIVIYDNKTFIVHATGCTLQNIFEDQAQLINRKHILLNLMCKWNF